MKYEYYSHRFGDIILKRLFRDRYIVPLLFISLLFIGCAAAGPSPAKLGTIERDVTYCVVEGLALKMDIYYPKASVEPAPALIYVHGGSWTGGDKADVNFKDVNEFTARGYFVASVNYRLAPQYKFPAQIDDVKCAVRFLRAKSADLGLDARRIGAWGFSAGGHLVALLGVVGNDSAFKDSAARSHQSSRVQAVVDQAGAVDLITYFRDKRKFQEQVFGKSDHDLETLKLASPVTYVSKDTPPFLIIHGDKDTAVPLAQSRSLCSRLISANVPVTLIVVENAEHGFVPVNGPVSPTREEITIMMADFFDKYLK